MLLWSEEGIIVCTSEFNKMRLLNRVIRLMFLLPWMYYLDCFQAFFLDKWEYLLKNQELEIFIGNLDIHTQGFIEKRMNVF